MGRRLTSGVEDEKEKVSGQFFVYQYSQAAQEKKHFPWKARICLLTSHQVLLVKARTLSLRLQQQFSYSDIDDVFYAPKCQLVKVSLITDGQVIYLNTGRTELPEQLVATITYFRDDWRLPAKTPIHQTTEPKAPREIARKQVTERGTTLLMSFSRASMRDFVDTPDLSSLAGITEQSLFKSALAREYSTYIEVRNHLQDLHGSKFTPESSFDPLGRSSSGLTLMKKSCGRDLWIFLL